MKGWDMRDKLIKEINKNLETQLRDISSSNELVSKASRVFNECKPAETIYISAMNLQVYGRYPEFKNSLDNALNREVDVSLIVSQKVINDSKNSEIISELRNKRARVYEIEEDQSSILNAPFSEYWNDTIITPRFLIYAKPHNPSSIGHKHEGFYTRDAKIVKEVYDLAERQVQNIRRGIPTRISIDTIVTSRFFDHNNEIIKKEIPDNWLIINKEKIIAYSQSKVKAQKYLREISEEIGYRNFLVRV